MARAKKEEKELTEEVKSKTAKKKETTARRDKKS